MMTDNNTNTLYLADYLPTKYPKCYADLEGVLNKYNIAFEHLPHTKDKILIPTMDCEED